MKEYKINPANSPSKIEDHHDYVVYRGIRIPMRDGVEIETSIFFPAVDGKVDFSKKYPVILNRTAYFTIMGPTLTNPPKMDYYSAEKGYVHVLSSVRNTYTSGGTNFRPMGDEGWGEHQDGVDTVAWIMKQPWCDGRVATAGISYIGGTQYVLQLAGDVPGLVTSAIDVPAVNRFGNSWLYYGDFLDQDAYQSWTMSMVSDQISNDHLPEETVKEILKDNEELGGPLDDMMVMASLNYAELAAKYGLKNIPILRRIPFYQDDLDHRDDPSFFSDNDTRCRKHDMKKPLLFISGWYDLLGYNSIFGYEQSVKDAPSKEVADGHRLIIGPWTHTFSLADKFPHSGSDLRVLSMEWIRRQMGDVTSEFFDEVPVAIYVMGENRWRAEKQWPLADAETCCLYLHSDGPANSVKGAGFISAEKPGESEQPDTYKADPSHPIFNGGGIGMETGPADQTEVEARDDVLVYTMPTLEEDLEVTGVIKASFYAATSATDTDFFVRVIDVDPEGNTINVITGGRRGRYLKCGRTNPTALVPGEINKYEITMRPTSYVFKKGHKLRVDICSSDAKFFDVNPNAFIDLNTCKAEDYVVADQTVYHDAAHPAVIELPVIPADRERNWITWPFETGVAGDVDFWKTVYNLPTTNEPVSKDASELPTAD